MYDVHSNHHMKRVFEISKCDVSETVICSSSATFVFREEKSFVYNYMMKRKQCAHTAAAARSSRITSSDVFP